MLQMIETKPLCIGNEDTFPASFFNLNYYCNYSMI